MNKMRCGKIRILSFFLSFLMIISIITLPKLTVEAADGKGVASYNLHNHNYRYMTYYNQWNWAEVSRSYMYYQDEKPVRVEGLSDRVVVEYYSSEFNLLSSKNINMELPVFGGFYCGKNALYLMFGQNNEDGSDAAETVRIVKYDYSWNRLGSVSFYGINTCYPFDAGGSDFAEYGNILYVRTCHEMYSGHQANMTFAINTDSMTEISSYWNVMNSSYGYVSHSFNQFIRIDGNKVVAVDHGDAYPRGVLLGQYKSDASLGKVNGSGYQNVNLVHTPGNTGANFTGTSVGGFEVASNNYMVAVSKVAYDGNFQNNKVRNVSVFLQPKNDFSEASTKEIKFTSYSEGSGKGCANPYLVKISDDLFVLMWEDLDTTSGNINNVKLTDTLEAVVIDGNGNKLSDIKTFTGALSDCKPIVYDGNLYWYGTGKSEMNSWGYQSNSESAPVFYELNVVKSSSSYILNLQNTNKEANTDFGNTKSVNTEQIRAFVVRFYKEVLGRSDAEIANDKAGVDDWTNKLVTKEKTGADVARGFAMSKEFTNKNLADDAFLKTMYKAFFDRDPDEGGYNGWMTKMENGTSREEVIAGFVNSQEFKNLCAKYGINPGEMKVSGEGQQNNNNQNNNNNNQNNNQAVAPLKLDASGVKPEKLDEYVERLYTKILKRDSEADGKKYWAEVIINGKDKDGNVYDAATAASKGFFNSKEYKNQNTSNEQFVVDCYAAFFNRDPRGTDDEVNYQDWVNQLNEGKITREYMIEKGFGKSKEFKNLLTSYGFKIIE